MRPRSTKYGFENIPVGESKEIKSVSRSLILQVIRSWNSRRPKEQWIGIMAFQDGDKVIVKRTY